MIYDGKMVPKLSNLLRQQLEHPQLLTLAGRDLGCPCQVDLHFPSCLDRGSVSVFCDTCIWYHLAMSIDQGLPRHVFV